MAQSITDFAAWDVIRSLLIWIYVMQIIELFVEFQIFVGIVVLVFSIQIRVVQSRSILLFVCEISSGNDTFSGSIQLTETLFMLYKQAIELLDVKDVSLAQIGTAVSLDSEPNFCRTCRVLLSLVSGQMIRVSLSASFLTAQMKIMKLERR